MSDEEATGLPASMELAWGLRRQPGKGPKRGLSLTRVLDAAIAVADRDGLAGVSMARVAAELDASTMALYRYVATKDELLTLMSDAAFGLPPEARPAGGWRPELSSYARAELAALRQHPWMLRVAFREAPIGPNNTRWLEWGLRSLAGFRVLRAREKMSIILLLSGYVRNWAQLSVDVAEYSRTRTGTVDFARALAKLIDPFAFPEVSAVLAEGGMDDNDGDDDAEFTFGLERILDGIETLVTTRAAPGSDHAAPDTGAR